MSNERLFQLAMAGATAAGVIVGFYMLYTRDDDFDKIEDESDRKLKQAETRRRMYRSEVINLTFRALKAVALADGVFHEKERELLQHCTEVLTVPCPDLDALEPISAAELATKTVIAKEPEKQADLLTLMVHLSLVDGDEHPEEYKLVKKFAEAFGVESETLAALRQSVLQKHKVSSSELGKKHPAMLTRRASSRAAAILLGSKGTQPPSAFPVPLAGDSAPPMRLRVSSADFSAALASLCHR